MHQSLYLSDGVTPFPSTPYSHFQIGGYRYTKIEIHENNSQLSADSLGPLILVFREYYPDLNGVTHDLDVWIHILPCIPKSDPDNFYKDGALYPYSEPPFAIDAIHKYYIGKASEW